MDLAPDVLRTDDVLLDVRRRERPEASEHADLGVSDDVRLQRPRRLHRDHAEDLEHVVLEHVAESTDALVIADAAGEHLARLVVVLREPFFLGHGDLDVVDVLLVPERLEDAVGEPDDQEVLDGFLAEIMVDAICLIFLECMGDRRDHPPGAVEVMTDGLLDDHPREGGRLARRGDEAGGLELLHAAGDEPRRDREVEDAAAGDAELLVDLLQLGLERGVGLGLVERALDVEQGPGEVVPVVLFQRLPGEPLDAGPGSVADPLIRLPLGAEAEADDGEVRGQDAVDVEVVDGGEELAPGEVPGGAEDHQHAGLGEERLGRARRQRVQAFNRNRHDSPPSGPASVRAARGPR